MKSLLFVSLLFCLLGALSTQRVACGKACTKEYLPVCGESVDENGIQIYKTFGNNCVLESANSCGESWKKAYDGECCKPSSSV